MKPQIALAAALVLALSACQEPGPADAADAPNADAAPAAPAGDAMDDPAAPPPLDQPAEDVPPATAGSLRVGLPAEGTIGFDGFGPAEFGATAEEVRMAWGGDLGDPQPSEPGGCYYLIPQPLTEAGYRVAFMIEGDRFVRIDVRAEQVTAPGGGKVGMGAEEIAGLYPGLEERPHKYVEGAKYLRVPDPDGGEGVLLFDTDAEGQVDEWRIGLPPQVDYVEGCS